ncbi:MAG: 50S ribosomal protein L11 methyltransferase [Bacteroidota bacterium]|nr:50S ribosomal protein L11 methyltransferase [Bacteroidota bacterium]
MYIAYHFTITPKEPGTEILLAELEYTPFESFEETDFGLSAYVQKQLHTTDILSEVMILDNPEFKITYQTEEIPTVNWNEEWEKNFSPIIVNNECVIRAPFHDAFDYQYEIIIEPKMSFGTGHHQTTYMMLKHILDEDFSGKRVLDMGCGTAVLAILAQKRGAIEVDAIDIDNWCYINSIENIERNKCENINIYEGGVELISGKQYDIIIANINRNILLQQIPDYALTLSKDGLLFLSGFYTEDIPQIDEMCQKNNLTLLQTLEKDNWVALKYQKL